MCRLRADEAILTEKKSVTSVLCALKEVTHNIFQEFLQKRSYIRIRRERV